MIRPIGDIPSESPETRRRARRVGRGLRLGGVLALAIAAALPLGGCKTLRSGDPSTTGSIGPGPDAAQVAGSAAEWTERYQANPDDLTTALSFAQALRREGRAAQATEVLQRAMMQNPGHPAIASAYGKALAEKGDFDEALKVLRSANSPRTPDWRLTSAEGAVQDQLGNAAEARRLYDAALKIAPEEPSVLNNLGMSYVLTNELPKAETALRRAAASPRADGKVRQNLALVVGLQGRFDEATTIATRELPREEAEANVRYLRSMLSQPNTWKQLKSAEKPAERG